MMELYVLGKLEKYKEVFDLKYFGKNQRRFMRTVYVNQYKDDWVDVYRLLAAQDKITIIDKIMFARKYISNKLKKLIK